MTAEGLQPDPRWQWGRLANGLRYVVRRNALPAGHVSYRFAVEVGGAHEQKEEQGFAHFVEHMAFNGTRHFKGETLAGEMERRGISFGPELSAFTFLTHTLYQIDAPSNKLTDVDWTLTVLRDFADGLLFETRQVKRERGVIAAETRDRVSVGQRYDRARRWSLYPVSPLSNRIEGDPQAATAGKLRAFHEKWYRPDRMILVVVGDVEPAALATAVERQFNSLKTTRGAPPSFDPGFLANPKDGTTYVVHDAEAGGLLLETISVKPYANQDSAAERRRFLAGSMATQILQERLLTQLRLHPKSYTLCWARIQSPTPFSNEASVALQANSKDWFEAAQILEKELRQSFEYTFFPSEITQTRSRIIQGYEQHVKASATAHSDELAGWVMQEALWHQVSLAPTDALALARTTLSDLDAVEINRAWRSYWEKHRAQIFGYGFFPLANGTDLIADAYGRSSREKLFAPTPPPSGTFAYTDFGPLGRLVRRRHEAAADMYLLEFANGIRVNLKHTEFEANTVYLGGRLGTGLLSEPTQSPGLGALASMSLLDGGLGRHPPEQLSHLLSAEPITLQFQAREADFLFNGSAASQRLELLLQLFCAYVTDAAWDPKAFEGANTKLLAHHADLSRTTEGALGLHAFRIATNDDRRYAAVAEADLARLSLSDVKAWLNPQLQQGPLEIGLVGDFPVEETIALLARTVGALPARTGFAPPEFPVRFSKVPGEHAVPVEYPSGRAALEVLWPADMGQDVHRSRRLEVLGALLHNRLNTRVREDLGAAYAPAASYWKSETPAEEGYLTAFLTTEPKVMTKVTKLVWEAADDFARHGASPEEFATAINPLIGRTHTQLNGNSYWLWNISLYAQSKPGVLTWPLTRISDYEQMTVSELNRLAQEILPRTKAMTFTALPPPR